MSIAIIHINRSHIQKNRNGSNLPLYTIKLGGPNVRLVYAWAVRVLGPSYLGDPQRDCRPLSCGAQSYITTHDDVELYDQDGNVFGGIYYEDAVAAFGKIEEK